MITMEENELINLADWQYSEKGELGPGKRFFLWVQGCPFSCPFCIAPTWIPQRPNKLMGIEKLIEMIMSFPIDGLTISGGEPFLQARLLAKLVRKLRKRKSLDLIVFSGYQFEELNRREEGNDRLAFLQEIDVLIDGQYVAEKNDGIGLRGSSNQVTHFLSDRLIKQKDYFISYNRRMNAYEREESVLLAGVPPKGLEFKLLYNLSKQLDL